MLLSKVTQSSSYNFSFKVIHAPDSNTWPWSC